MLVREQGDQGRRRVGGRQHEEQDGEGVELHVRKGTSCLGVVAIEVEGCGKTVAVTIRLHERKSVLVHARTCSSKQSSAQKYIFSSPQQQQPPAHFRISDDSP